MNLQKRQKLYQDIVKYLTTPLGISTLTGKPTYPTLFDASVKFGYHANHIFRIKKALLGLDKEIPGRGK